MFASQVNDTRNLLDKVKYTLKNFKEQSKHVSQPASVSFENTFDTLAEIKSSMRELTQQVMERKRQAEAQRKVTDDVNLTLQSYMYEASHYQREIYFCKEFRTPELDQVLKMAQER